MPPPSLQQPSLCPAGFTLVAALPPSLLPSLPAPTSLYLSHCATAITVHDSHHAPALPLPSLISLYLPCFSLCMHCENHVHFFNHAPALPALTLPPSLQQSKRPSPCTILTEHQPLIVHQPLTVHQLSSCMTLAVDDPHHALLQIDAVAKEAADSARLYKRLASECESEPDQSEKQQAFAHLRLSMHSRLEALRAFLDRNRSVTPRAPLLQCVSCFLSSGVSAAVSAVV